MGCFWVLFEVPKSSFDFYNSLIINTFKIDKMAVGWKSMLAGRSLVQSEKARGTKIADRPEQFGKPAIAGGLALLSASDYICTHILRSCFKKPVSNFLRKNFKQLLNFTDIYYNHKISGRL